MSETVWFADGIKGRHVLLGFIAFFGVIFLANGIFLYYALETFGGGDTTDPYRKGLHYNETLAEAARQDAQGWRTELIYGADRAAHPQPCTTGTGMSPYGLHLEPSLGRPATDVQDVTLKLGEAAAGTSMRPRIHLAPGQWVVSATADDPSRAGEPTYPAEAAHLIVPETP